MEKLSQAELIEKVAQATGITKKTVKEVIDGFAYQVTAHCGAGTAVSTKLGKFYPKDSESRTGRNPRNGEQIEIQAKRTLAFKPSADNKDLA